MSDTDMRDNRSRLLDPGLHKWVSRVVLVAAGLVVVLFPLRAFLIDYTPAHYGQ